MANFNPKLLTKGLGTLRQAQCIAGDWGLGTGGLGTRDWGLD
ncbi:MAG: hypothetical protein HEQ35_30970 [Gloeotrichia echinulata IR180]